MSLGLLICSLSSTSDVKIAPVISQVGRAAESGGGGRGEELSSDNGIVTAANISNALGLISILRESIFLQVQNLIQTSLMHLFLLSSIIAECFPSASPCGTLYLIYTSQRPLDGRVSIPTSRMRTLRLKVPQGGVGQRQQWASSL